MAAVVRVPSPARQVYDPSHPDTDPQTGLVVYPNVDTTTEMTDLLSAGRDAAQLQRPDPGHVHPPGHLAQRGRRR
jgi:flagellar basal body rod protein FlgC